MANSSNLERHNAHSEVTSSQSQATTQSYGEKCFNSFGIPAALAPEKSALRFVAAFASALSTGIV